MDVPGMGGRLRLRRGGLLHAILLRELMHESHDDFKVQIYATDLDDDAIATAQAGACTPSIVQDVTPERLRPFFLKDASVAELTARVLLQSFAPAPVVTDRAGEIVCVHGETGRYLRPAPSDRPRSSRWRMEARPTCSPPPDRSSRWW